MSFKIPTPEFTTSLGLRLQCDPSKHSRKYIKEQEKSLGRHCTRVWLFENRLGEVFMFGRFCKGQKDTIIVTIGKYIPAIGFI